MFGLSGGDVLTLLVIGIVLIGPKKLPGAARNAAILIKKARTIVSHATAELKENLGPEFEDLDLTDLNPKNMVRKELSGVIGESINSISEPMNEVKESIEQVAPDFSKFKPIAELDGLNKQSPNINSEDVK